MTKATKCIRQLTAATCAAAALAAALAGTAFAATVSGADYRGSGSVLESGEVDVLNVDGAAGETVFLSVQRGSDVLAKNLPYTIGATAGASDDATWAGVATLDIDGLDLTALDGSYTVQAYADRAGNELLYTGALYGVYADLPNGEQKLIGTRTASASELTARSFEPAETLYEGGRTYRLTGQAASDGGVLHYTYAAYDEATTVDGVVKYTDATGATVASTKIAGLAYGESRTVSIPAVITGDDGNLYRTVSFTGSVTATNPGATSFSVYCVKMSDADQAVAGYYVATIQMVDAAGAVIATDSVNVTGEFVYTAPSTIYKSETDAATGETRVVTYKISQSPTVRLSAANDGVLNRTRTISVSYEAQALDVKEVSVTFNLIDGSRRAGETGRELGTKQVVVSKDMPTATPESQIQIDGATYYLAGDPSDYAYTLNSGAVPTVDVYYTPEGYEAPGPYDVTVNYVNFLTNETVESHTYTSDTGDNSRILISSPETFSANGANYVRLAGQEEAIAHSYYSGIASYTVYYRDENDELSSGVVINTLRVVYGDGTAAGNAAAASAAADGTAAAGSADSTSGNATDGATALQLNASRSYNVMDGEAGNGSLTNESGVDSNAERIEDSETPLASGFDKGAQSGAASSLVQSLQWVVPIGIAVVIAIVIAAVIVRTRRKAGEERNW